MALINTAKTRIGLGGPSKNYTRPVAAKAPRVAVAIQQLIRGFTRNIGRLMNP